jgi:signal transduction histidine kinase
VDDRLDSAGPRRAVWLTLAGWAVGLVVTGLVLWSPDVLFGYRSPSLHLVVDSVDSCVALLVAYLLSGRFMRSRRLQDLLLAQGLVLLAVAGAGLSFISESLGEDRDGTFDVWLPLTLRLIGAVLILSAGLVSAAPEVPFKSGWWVLAVPAAVAVVTASLMWGARHLLPLAIDQSGDPALQPTLFAVHPLVTAAQGISALCFFVASIVFTIRAADRTDPLLFWLGPACALAAFARVNYVLFPSLYTDWFYTGDLLRTGFFLLLLLGASREIKQYWDAYSRVAVLEDRRRLARELHDGVIQELALLRMEGSSLPHVLLARGHILTTCDRALDEARAAVHVLGRGGDEALGLVLRRTARELSQRYRVCLDVEADESVEATAEQQHALVRITREAVANAVHHGRAGQLCIRLSREGDRQCLVVRDDGMGFDVARATGAAAGYGLISMQDRARALPGSLDLVSRPGEGSKVTVRW